MAVQRVLNQLTLQVRGGQFSGAAQVNIEWIGALNALGKLRDLGPAAEGLGYTDAALAAGQFDGAQVGLPWTIGAIGLITNTELLEQAGMASPPASIEDFEAALSELKGLGNGVIPYAASTKVGQLRDILAWMETFGSLVLDGDQVTIGDDASIETVAWYKKLYDDELIAPDVDRFDARSLFAQGQAAIYDDSMVARGSVVAESPDPDMESKLGVISRPVVASGDAPRAILWGHVVVEGDGADTASEFAQWLTSDTDTVVNFFEELALPPTTQEGLDSGAVRNDEFTTAFVDRVRGTCTFSGSGPGEVRATCVTKARTSCTSRRSPASSPSAVRRSRPRSLPMTRRWCSTRVKVPFGRRGSRSSMALHTSPASPTATVRRPTTTTRSAGPRGTGSNGCVSWSTPATTRPTWVLARATMEIPHAFST